MHGNQKDVVTGEGLGILKLMLPRTINQIDHFFN